MNALLDNLSIKAKPTIFGMNVLVSVSFNGLEYKDYWHIGYFLRMSRNLPDSFWVKDCMVKLNKFSRVQVEDQFQLVAEQLLTMPGVVIHWALELLNQRSY